MAKSALASLRDYCDGVRAKLSTTGSTHRTQPPLISKAAQKHHIFTISGTGHERFASDTGDLSSIATAHAQITKVKALPILPGEVIAKIITFAMIAEQWTIEPVCVTGIRYAPDINVNCLVLNQAFYHVARAALFRENLFLFQNFGTDIKDIIRPRGLLSCRQNHCSSGGDSVTLNNVKFVLGSCEDHYYADIQITAFCNAIKGLRSKLQINNLEIELCPYSFRSDGAMYRFCDCLDNVIVHKQLTLYGLDIHLELHTRIIVGKLAMCAQPIEYQVKFRDADYGPGYFCVKYVPDRREDGLQDPAVLRNFLRDLDDDPYDDPTTHYREWKRSATLDAINNSRDYISVF